MEATIFTGWIYDYLLPHAAAVKVAHPVMLRVIAAAKKKNDRIDAGKIADCLRCDFLPECHMATTEIRDRRRTLRYRHLLVRQMVQMKNRISGLLLETGVTHNKQRLHKVKYFRELLLGNDRSPKASGRCYSSAATRSSDCEDGVCLSQLPAARSLAGGASQTAYDCARCGPHYRAKLGLGDRGCVAFPITEAGDQLLRPVRG